MTTNPCCPNETCFDCRGWLRKTELIQCAAVIQAWLWDLDSRTHPTD